MYNVQPNIIAALFRQPYIICTMFKQPNIMCTIVKQSNITCWTFNWNYCISAEKIFQKFASAMDLSIFLKVSCQFIAVFIIIIFQLQSIVSDCWSSSVDFVASHDTLGNGGRILPACYPSPSAPHRSTPVQCVKHNKTITQFALYDLERTCFYAA